MKKVIFLGLLIPHFLLFRQVLSQGRTEAGLTLLEASGARSAALGEAFSAAQNDVTAFTYNPATLDTLKSSHVSFLYQQGLSQDSFGHFLLGLPTDKHCFGMSMGYYNSGKIDTFDGTSQRTVSGQKDLNLNFGYATSFGKVSIGLAGKYLSSTLGEKVSATAFAGGFGLMAPINSRLNVGMSLQNIGSEIKYESIGDPLPRIGRVGFSWLLISESYPTTLLLEAPYYMNQKELHPSAGLETLFGPLAVRAGYKSGSDLEEFSIGTGFSWGRSTLDYSFGFVDKLESLHRVSYSMRFGHMVGVPSMVKSKEEPKKEEKKEEAHTLPIRFEAPKREAFEIKPLGGHELGHQVYVVKEGDTLKSVAQRYYGRGELWQGIYQANQHLLSDPNNLVVGQKILIPKRMGTQ